MIRNMCGMALATSERDNRIARKRAQIREVGSSEPKP